MSCRPACLRHPARLRLAGVAAALGIAVTGCSQGAGTTSSALLTVRVPAPTTAPTTAGATPAARPLPVHHVRAPAGRTETRAPLPKRVAASTPTCSVPASVHAAQAIVVTSSGDRATIRACRRTGSHYLLSLGPYAGHVGLHGVSADKVEGDLKTPAGVFPLLGGFGEFGNPGLAQGWFVTDSHDVWVDDPESADYNRHERTPAAGRWTSAEPLHVSPVYLYAQVIGYNLARTPGRGSAIFFHVDKGSGTAGCVSVPEAQLLAIFRWERSGAVIAIS